MLKTIYLVAGARPNFVKIAPLYRRLCTVPGFDVRIVHTGQHYDRAMSAVFFEQLRLPDPHVSLDVGSAPHGAQTGRVLERFEARLLIDRPAIVVVVGDVNSTLACALAAAKITYPDGSRPLVAHVEAGLRSGDRSMPEELNRMLTDALADMLFTTEQDARANLLREGIDDDRIEFVGNVMIDCLVDTRTLIESRRAWADLDLERGGYGLVTLHRPSNVDRDETLGPIVETLGRIAERLPLVFPVHPRTRGRVEALGLGTRARLHLVPPLAYIEFLSLLSGARIVLTDSGGVQEEATFLRVPCLTLRDNTERPVTITHGTNTLVGSRPTNLEQLVAEALARPPAVKPMPPLWDGHASDRIAEALAARLSATADVSGIERAAIGS